MRPRLVDANLSISQGLNMIGELKEYILEHIQTTISMVLISDLPDLLVFTPSDRGVFSTKEFLKHNRVAGVERLWTRWVWNPHFPPNVAPFHWKLIRHALPVDTRIQSRGTVLVSSYRCSVNPSPSLYLFYLCTRRWHVPFGSVLDKSFMSPTHSAQ